MASRSIKYLRLDDLVPAPRNPRRHDLENLRASVSRFGFVSPAILDERTGRLVAGHGRAETLVEARNAGIEAPEGIRVDKTGAWSMPVVHGWSSKDDAEAEAYLISDNQGAGWDDAALAEMLSELDDLAGTGFDDAEVERLLSALHSPSEGKTDPDEIPEVAKPITRRGDLWIMGDHRLLCGDATKREDYDRVLGGEHLTGALITDPPYGVAIGAKNRALDQFDRAGQVLTDLAGDRGIEEVEALWRAAFDVWSGCLAPGTPYYVFGPQGGDLGLLLLLLLLLRDAKLSPRHILIWKKNRPSFSLGRLDYDYQHEPIVYGWQPGAAHPWYADGSRTSILEYDRPAASPDHPTTKPVALIEELIGNSVPVGGIVLDPFLGSGTALVAAERLGRRCLGLEIDPHYCDVAVRRWEEFTGSKAKKCNAPA